MSFLATCIDRVLTRFVGLVPLPWWARAGRCVGLLAWWLDFKHRAVVLQNLDLSLGSELTADHRRRIAIEHFKRIGENYASAIKTASMPESELLRHVRVSGFEASLPPPGGQGIHVLGHFGNFEVLARLRREAQGRKLATTYRAPKSPLLNRIVMALRHRSGIDFYERTQDAKELRKALQAGDIILGILSDQHSGKKGLWIPFLGRHCSTTPAPAIYALRFRTPLWVTIVHREALARWVVEVTGPIQTVGIDGLPRSPESIMREANTHLEAAVRRDPANWFWVHRRWKPPSARQLSRATHSGANPANDPAPDLRDPH